MLPSPLLSNVIKNSTFNFLNGQKIKELNTRDSPTAVN